MQPSWRATRAGLYWLPVLLLFQSPAACQRMHRATSVLLSLQLHCIFESSQVGEIKTALGLWPGMKAGPGSAELVNSALAIVNVGRFSMGWEAGGNCCYEFAHHGHGCKCNSRSFQAGCIGRRRGTWITVPYMCTGGGAANRLSQGYFFPHSLLPLLSAC